jgi:tripartite-type tricarboxylate transporter receptor subunit TctC
MRSLCLSLASAIGLALGSGVAPAFAQQFYEGKTVTIVVGASAGGGFDTYARAIGRHIGRHISGDPKIIVENRPGAGSLIAANYLYKAAKPDGLTVGHFLGGLIFGQVLGQPGIEFDARKFEYIGVPVQETSICALSRKSGIADVAQWAASKTPVKMGSVGRGDFTDDIPKILQSTIGVPNQVVAGYKGTAEIRLAVESGELDGVCMGWDSIKATWRRALDAGEVRVLLQVVPKPHPDLAALPLAVDLAKTAEAKSLIEAGIHYRSATFRPYVLPPGTPKDRVEALRRAFTDVMKDRQFMEDAKKSNLEVDPLPGEEVARMVGSLFGIEPRLAARLKAILQ